jgi:gluconate 2-dehydrogenase gamma chain
MTKQISTIEARRGFLRKSIVILPAAALTMTGQTQEAASNAAATAKKAAQQPEAYLPTFFHPQEWAFVHAAVARLIPADQNGPGALEAGVPEFIDRQMDAIFGHGSIWYMQGPFVDSAPEFGYQGKLAPREVYRAGIAASDAHCQKTLGGKPFAQLEAAQQDQVLKDIETGAITLDGVDGKAFFGFLLQNTREGFLSDPMHGGNKNMLGWKLIGFPGARADFADWVGRPGEAYPLPPVSIHGQQG